MKLASKATALVALTLCLVLQALAKDFKPAALRPKGAGLPNGLSIVDWKQIRAEYEKHRHGAFPSVGGGLEARSFEQQWLSKFDARGFTVTPDEGKWTWGLELAGLPAKATLSQDVNRITYRWSQDLDEWYLNDTRGLEHGFTLRAPRAEIRLAVRGGLRPRLAGAGVEFADGEGVARVKYTELRAWDASGKQLPAQMKVEGKQVVLMVDDRGAKYPVTVDPVAQQAYLKASNTGTDDNFGFAVGISGNTVVVTAIGEGSNATGVNGNQSDNSASNSGAAYVFVRSGSTWTQQAWLKASNTSGNDRFGWSVAMSNDTIVVGAPFEDSSATGIGGSQSDGATDAGAAYVFFRSGTSWSQQAYLKASNTQADDLFGWTVAMDADTVVVGAQQESSSATGVNGNQADNSANHSGAAYVFFRSGSSWSQQAYLKASNTGSNDQFSWGLGISGDTIVSGARGEDGSSAGVNGSSNENAPDSGAAYVFVRSGTNWSQQAYLKASNPETSDGFGFSVGISVDTIVVGAPDEDSNATGIGGNQADNSAAGSGAAYVFVRSGTNWSQQAYLKASNTDAGDQFGYFVGTSGNLAVIGAYREDSNATGVGGNGADNSAGDAGAAYLFTRSGSTWTQDSYLKASNTGADDRVGIAVGVDSTSVVVGAFLEDSNATGVNGSGADNSSTNSGAAYVFAPAGVSVTIASTPTGRTFDVSGSGCAAGTGYTTPAVLSWTPGSSCTVTINPVTQSGTAGTQYVFSSWENSSTASVRVITAPSSATTYTATFTTQYQVTTSASPVAGGSVTAGAFVNAGSSFVVTATPNSGYTFSGFTGALTGTTNPQTLTVNGPLTVTAGFAQNQTVNLVALYRFDNTSNLGLDSSSNGNNLTANVGSPASGTAKFGAGGLSLNGSAGLTTSTGSVPSGFPTGNTNYSIAAWVKTSATGKGIIGWGNFGSDNLVTALRTDSPGFSHYWWGNDLVGNTTSIVDNVFHHVVATFDGSVRKVYVDGTLNTSDSPGSSHNATSANFAIGRTNNNEFMNGTLDDVAVFTGALSQTQVTAIFGGDFSAFVAGSQTITFGALPNKVFGSGTFAVTATGGASGNPVTFSSTTTAVCTVSGSTVTLVSVGTCTIQANQAGNTNYAAAPAVNQSFTVTQASQTITFGALSNQVFGSGTFALSATGGASGNAVTFTSTTTGICTVSGSTVTLVSAGTCTIQANQAGNTNYAAATAVNQSFSVTAASQTINFPALTDRTFGTGTFAVSATGGASGNAVTFTSTTTAICTVSGTTVTLVASGTCTIQANQAGNANYAAATAVNQSFSITQATQTITFGALSDRAFASGTFAVSATGGPSGNAVTFTSTTPGTCTVSGSTVTLVAVGTCTIQANQASSANYAAASAVNQSFSITQASQTITFGALSDRAFASGTFAVSATGGASGNAVTFTSTTTAICTVSGSTVTLVAVGTCTLQANQAGSANYAAATAVNQSFSVTPGVQTITFAPLADKVFGSGTFAVTATGGASGNAVTFTSTTTGICTVSGSTVTLVAVGTCTIQANQASSANYAAATSADRSFSVTPGVQTITFAPLTNKVFGSGTFGVSATGGPSGNAVTFTSTTPGTCTVSGSTVTLVAVGTCTIQANQAGSANYSAATAVNQSFSITPASQTIDFQALTDRVFGSGSFTVSATGGASGNAVTFTSATLSVCTVSGTTVTLVAAGTCTIQANQASSANYAAATAVNQSFSITPVSQTLNFPALTDRVFGSGTFTVSATGGASGNAVTFTSTTPSVCTVSGTTVTLLAAGTCTLQANQAGNGGYSAATSVNQSFSVTQITQTITFGALSDRVYSTSTFTVSATGGASGNPVVFSSTTPTVCNVAGSTVSLASGGTCNIRANQAGTTNYAAAASVDRSFNVARLPQTITFAALSSRELGSGTIPVSATGGASANPVSFVSLDNYVCTVAGTTVSLIAVGTCAVRAAQAGNSIYSDAMPVVQSFSVSPATQIIALSPMPADLRLGAAGFTLTVTGGLSGNPVVLTAASSACSVFGRNVTVIAAGTCTILASQAGNANYAPAAAVSQSAVILKGIQTITFDNLPGRILSSGSFAVYATGGASGNPVLFSSTTTGVCTVSGSTVTPLAPGVCTITASQPGNTSYNAAAPQTRSFSVALTKAGQAISPGTPSPIPVQGSTATLGVTGGASGNPVVLTSTTPAVCTVSGTTFTFPGWGTCGYTATQAGNTTFFEGKMSGTFAVRERVTTTLTNISGATVITSGAPIDLRLSVSRLSGWTATGNATVYDNDVPVASTFFTGQDSMTYRFSPTGVGVHTYRAELLGTTMSGSSASNQIAVTVVIPPTLVASPFARVTTSLVNERIWTVRIKNTGLGTATNPKITGITILSTVAAATPGATPGTAAPGSTLYPRPVAASIAPGLDATAAISMIFPTNVSRMTVRITMAADNGYTTFTDISNITR